MAKASNKSWAKIFQDYKITNHDFSQSPFLITAEQIKKSVQRFQKTNEKEVRILCSQTKREDRPDIMIDSNLFLLPIKNGTYVIVRGEGYVNIPEIPGNPIQHKAQIDFDITTSYVGDSEMQHIDFAFAVSIMKTFLQDTSLVVTIRGRKYTPSFSFYVGKHKVDVESVQTEVDVGYEGREQIVLVEAKNSNTKNTIIRQMYYPFRQWSDEGNNRNQKKVRNVFFEKQDKEYMLWEYEFTDIYNYNSIGLVQMKKYILVL